MNNCNTLEQDCNCDHPDIFIPSGELEDGALKGCPVVSVNRQSDHHNHHGHSIRSEQLKSEYARLGRPKGRTKNGKYNNGISGGHFNKNTGISRIETEGGSDVTED
jgi:hypothetical protein